MDSDEELVRAIEARRIDALLSGDVAVLDEIIEDKCTHVESTGASRTKSEFLSDVAKREFSFELFEIEEDDIRIIGHTAVVAGSYRNIVRKRGAAGSPKHARHLRVYRKVAGTWKLVAHQATEISNDST